MKMIKNQKSQKIVREKDKKYEINTKMDKEDDKSDKGEKKGMIENKEESEKSGMIKDKDKDSEKNEMIENNINNKDNKDKKSGMIKNEEKSGMIKENINNNVNNVNFNNKNKSILLFYNVKGELLKRFVCPCHVNSFSWGFSSTLALAADKYIYIAFTKFKHKWTYLNDTIVFAYLIADQKYNIIFLNTSNDTKQCKLVYNLIDVISSDFYCGLIQESKEKKEYTLMITNNFCNVLETKLIPIRPLFYAMNNQFIIISG